VKTIHTRIRRALGPWMDIEPDDHEWALDGCGVPTPRLPLREMARAYARLVHRAREGRPDAAAVVRAMKSRPDLTSSPGRAPLVLMEATGGRLLAKEGAEGVLCLASVEDDWGMAVKVEDGGLRAVGPAVVAVLEAADMLSGAERRALEVLQDTPIRNTLGAEVGRVTARVAAGDDIPGRPFRESPPHEPPTE
jgi:L-asparaginase II